MSSESDTAYVDLRINDQYFATSRSRSFAPYQSSLSVKKRNFRIRLICFVFFQVHGLGIKH